MRLLQAWMAFKTEEAAKNLVDYLKSEEAEGRPGTLQFGAYGNQTLKYPR